MLAATSWPTFRLIGWAASGAQTDATNLLQLLLREQDMLPHSWIIFNKLELVWEIARILALHIKVARASGANQLNEDAHAFFTACHALTDTLRDTCTQVFLFCPIRTRCRCALHSRRWVESISLDLKPGDSK